MTTQKTKIKAASILVLIGNCFAALSIIAWGIMAIFMLGGQANGASFGYWPLVVYSYPLWGILGSIIASQKLKDKSPIWAIAFSYSTTILFAWLIF